MQCMNGANVSAFLTTSTLGAVTIGAVIGAASVGTATTAAVVGTVALSILAILAGGASIGAITAWFSTTDGKAGTYFENFGKGTAVAIPGMIQFAAQTFLQALIQGGASRVRDKISGRPGINVN